MANIVQTRDFANAYPEIENAEPFMEFMHNSWPKEMLPKSRNDCPPEHLAKYDAIMESRKVLSVCNILERDIDKLGIPFHDTVLDTVFTNDSVRILLLYGKSCTGKTTISDILKLILRVKKQIYLSTSDIKSSEDFITFLESGLTKGISRFFIDKIKVKSISISEHLYDKIDSLVIENESYIKINRDTDGNMEKIAGDMGEDVDGATKNVGDKICNYVEFKNILNYDFEYEMRKWDIIYHKAICSLVEN